MFFRLLAFLALLPAAVFAQDHSRAILVLDASGSMWGQIGGVNKIVIARNVIDDLLETLPDDLDLGLMAYGHRTKGDCGDIELLVPPGGDRGAIAAAVNGINPKGKTPLSAAVIAAAEELKYTEEAATVILVSDGIETCEYDPCEVGAKLEQAGVNFTAHVIGFDVADPAARAQLQCLAQETGGKFLSASNADELAQALDEVVVTPPPPPPPPEPPAVVPAAVNFRAIDGFAGPDIADGLVWNVTMEDSGPALENGSESHPVLMLEPGRGHVSVLRLADEATAEKDFTVFSGEDMRITLELPPFLPAASLMAADTAPAGSMFPVDWQGPGQTQDYLATANPGDGRSEFITYRYLRDSDTHTLPLRIPPVPGSYEIRYILDDGGKVLATRMVEVTPVEVSITPPEGATIGAEVPVDWIGPDYEGDFISVAKPGSDDGDYETYAYTSGGAPAKLTMPATAGEYELRYVFGASRYVAARVPFRVDETSASVSAPDSAPVGATIEVSWTGPDTKNDYISIARVGEDDGRYSSYSYTRDGSPLKLDLPSAPGDYEIRYVLGQDSKVLARQPITLTPVQATLDAPDNVGAGAPFDVGWTGPGYSRDYISIAEPGADDGRYETYTYTNSGNPAELTAPTVPGTYELRYVLSADKHVVIGRRALTVTEVGASLDAPPSAAAGSVIEVEWQGPGGDRDYISLAVPGAKDTAYEVYERPRDTPVEIHLPNTPGSYELRYVLNGSPAVVLARVPIQVTEVTASVDAPPSAPAGSVVKVGWEGPGDRRDYIALSLPGAKDSSQEVYERTRENPVELRLPNTPGSYELRYVQNGSPVTVLASVPFQITPVTASVDAPPSAPAGSIVTIGWEGPGDPRDSIALSLPGAKDSSQEVYERTRQNPVELRLPNAPGSYELRYVQNGSPVTVLASVPFQVTEVTASLDAPPSAPAGTELAVGWEGPGANTDYVAIAEPGSDDRKSLDYARTRDNPVRLDLPDTPGSYELRYVQDGSPVSVLARVPLQVTEVTASLEAPPAGPAGGMLSVGWQGLGEDGDFIAIAEPGSALEEYVTYARGPDNPAKLALPTEPGSYELRYVRGSRPLQLLASQPLKVTEVAASLTAPTVAKAGGELEVSWQGPDNKGDFLSVAPVGSGDFDYAAYVYTSKGNPAVLRLPTTAGEFELRYVLSGNDPRVLARQPLTLE